MRLIVFLSAIALACSATLSAADQIPERALCSVCALKGGETEWEKVKAHSEHDGKVYYFCSENCKTEFDSDPVAYLPPLLPRPAPAFVVEMLEGGDKALADLRGKIVLVDFWATWCKPCLETMPRLQKLYSAYSDRGFEVLGISIDDDKDRVKKVKRIVDKLGISYPISLDAKQTPAWHQLKVKAIPAMYLLDREIQIVAQWAGKIDYAEVEKEVLRRLDKGVGDEGP
jgi:thiol-disulfide isomerase/thioredoxin